ncbi:hypothetical protein BDV09DRAFT_203574 [Aspergillus tetrazonus]
MSTLTETPFLPLSPTVCDARALASVTVEETAPSTADSISAESAHDQEAQPDLGERQYNYFSPFISERAVDEPRPLKVIYIGAGISGILAAIKFRQAVPDLDLTIYEKNIELGGTWFENKYPCCACGKAGTIPGNVSKKAHQSSDILEYWKRVAHKYDVRKHIRFQSRCIGAHWNDSTGKLFVQIADEADPEGRIFEDSADVLITETGLLNEWKWPAIPGLHGFKGKLLHSAAWDESYQIEQVAVIGAGSSGIQIVPALLDKVKGMDHYVRGKTWISSQHGGERLSARTAGKGGNYAYTEDEKQVWSKDTAAYIQYRKELELEMQTLYAKSQRGSKLLKELLPGYPLLLNVITNPIVSVDERGITTSCGTHRPVDVIRAETYLDLATDGFPKFFQSLGPNSFQGAGNLLIMMEQIHSYLAQLISRMAYDNIGLVEPRRAQVERFTNYRDTYFDRTVYSADCASWYKSSPLGASLEERKKGRVTTLWPGSSLHCLKALEKVTWEDYELQPYDGNEFGWFGNGWTVAERQEQVDAAT